jgi:hypothetical protein
MAANGLKIISFDQIGIYRMIETLQKKLGNRDFIVFIEKNMEGR